MAERKPYTTKTRQVILEYIKEQSEVTVSVADSDMLPPLKSLILKWGLLAQWLY